MVGASNITAGSITDTHVSPSAAIQLNKLATVTASRALVSDSSGIISASTVTATELEYVSGVTSAIQTQLNTKESILTFNAPLSRSSNTISLNPPYIGYQTGVYYASILQNNNSSTNTAISADILYAIPFYVWSSHTFDRVGIRVTTSIDAKHIRFGVYNDSNGVPGSLNQDLGIATTSGTSAQDAEVTISKALTPGWYWLAFVSDAALTLSFCATSANRNDFGYASLTVTVPTQRIQATFTYAALSGADPFPAYSLQTGGAPAIRLRA